MADSGSSVPWRSCTRCMGIEKPGGPRLLRCAPCATAGVLVMYCDRACQKADWKHHKGACGLPLQGALPCLPREQILSVDETAKLSRQISKWESANMRLVCWTLYQHWDALGIAGVDDTVLCVVGTGFSAGPDRLKRVPRLDGAMVFRLTDATISGVFGDDGAERAYAGTRNMIRLGVPPLFETVGVNLSRVSATMRAESGMLSAPCAHWSEVLEYIVAAQAQSFLECNARLKVEVERYRAWEAFMGAHGQTWARRRMPPLDALESDETTFRHSNWIDHPQFIAWYTAEFGESPLTALARRSLRDGQQDYAISLQRLKSWVAASPAERQNGLNLARLGHLPSADSARGHT